MGGWFLKGLVNLGIYSGMAIYLGFCVLRIWPDLQKAIVKLGGRLTEKLALIEKDELPELVQKQELGAEEMAKFLQESEVRHLAQKKSLDNYWRNLTAAKKRVSGKSLREREP